MVGGNGVMFCFRSGCPWRLRVYRGRDLGVRSNWHLGVCCRLRHLDLGSDRGTLHLGDDRRGRGHNNLGGELLSGD